MLGSVEIKRPVEEVFNYIENSHNSDTYINGEFRIKSLPGKVPSDGRYQLGSILQGEGRFFGQAFVKLIYKVEVLKQNQLVSLKSNGGKFDSEVNWALCPTGANATRLSLEINLKPTSGLMGFVTGLMASHIEPTVSRYIQRTLKQLKNNLEQTLPAQAHYTPELCMA